MNQDHVVMSNHHWFHPPAEAQYDAGE